VPGVMANSSSQTGIIFKELWLKIIVAFYRRILKFFKIENLFVI
jgi:hypothetical protein